MIAGAAETTDAIEAAGTIAARSVTEARLASRWGLLGVDEVGLLTEVALRTIQILIGGQGRDADYGFLSACFGVNMSS
jgi:hypothetical protein